MLGVEFETLISGFEEHAVRQADFTDLGEYVSAIAAGKVLEAASHVPEVEPQDIVIGGDLLCFAPGGRELGKPQSFQQAREYIDTLSGTWHHEVSAVCIWSEQQNLERAVDHIDVLLPPLTDPEKEEYLQIANPLNKAGGFNLASYAKILLKRGENPEETLVIRGSVTGVLGFPVELVGQLLRQYGTTPPVSASQLEARLRHDILSGKPL